MNVAALRTLMDYNYWATARILNAASRLTPEQFSAPGKLSYGGVRSTLLHIFGAESIWRKRAQEGISPTTPPGGDIADLASLRTAWQVEEGLMRSWVADLSDADVLRTFAYKSMKGQPFETVLWHALMHMFNHGTQHRAEVAMLLTDFGQSPGDVDMILYFREKGGG